MTAAEHEEGLISGFVVPEKRTRFGDFLKSGKRRGKILDRLNHFFDFIPERATQVPREDEYRLAARLRKLGAPNDAYIIGGGEADGLHLPLEEAIRAGMAESWGVVISCVPGKLCLYSQEYPSGDTYILRLPSSK